ncbi:TadE/TadG family type IV pilus assembly protein [Rhodobacter capsulatus]|jgi:Flp pilus assembly protein TadG|nr:hypothetical protein [Rhodobacter capsulatus]ETD00560.1 hypothetical protein U714_16705 [Rhodobacter capsulatus DE442]ETD74900.1 hypothetical protein U717_16670 [Rhodobacter capsulatus R121]ETE52641.1 hypothetical protein U715_16665 [Rhodobacter capsulatus Y262]MDS0928582.1 hypothetical protein [Rhodobacter capsulatus]TQD35907.1 hypothetical protein FKW81_07290 [Rhodobacter capsulatus]
MTASFGEGPAMLMRRLRRILRDERGSVPIEGMLGALLILGWYVIAFQFFDAFRTKAQALKASYTVADMISREETPIGPTYMTGAKRMFDFMMNSDASRSWMRVAIIYCPSDGNANTTIDCDGDTHEFALDKSWATGSIAVHTETTINAEKDRIPLMSEGDYAVILETSLSYNPIFDIGQKSLSLDGGQTWTSQGLSEQLRFSNFIITRARGVRNTWSDAS